MLVRFSKLLSGQAFAHNNLEESVTRQRGHNGLRLPSYFVPQQRQRLLLREGRLPHVRREKQKSGDQQQATPHDAYGRQNAQMLQAQPQSRGADGQDAEQDQAIDATDATLQSIRYDGEAITVHKDSTH